MKVPYLRTITAIATGGVIAFAASGNVLAAASGSDSAFNEMIGAMADRDTGSEWFNYYVENLNQEIAFKESSEAYGAAGPNGPLSGFDGYLSGFVAPDTGSRWFDMYVDAVGRDLKEKDSR